MEAIGANSRRPSGRKRNFRRVTDSSSSRSTAGGSSSGRRKTHPWTWRLLHLACAGPTGSMGRRPKAAARGGPAHGRETSWPGAYIHRATWHLAVPGGHLEQYSFSCRYWGLLQHFATQGDRPASRPSLKRPHRSKNSLLGALRYRRAFWRP